MELMAVILGLKGIIKQEIPIKYNNVEVRTDSRYVVDNRFNAIYIWSRQKWLNQYGKPVENAILWKELIKVLHLFHCKVDFIWIKGHAHDLDNKAVDHLAKNSAKSLLKPPLVNVTLRRKKSKSKTVRGSIEMKGQRISIYIINEEFLRLQKLSKYRYEVISKGSRYYGNVDIAFSELHHLKAGHKYIVTFNKDNRNPQILKLIQEII